MTDRALAFAYIAVSVAAGFICGTILAEAIFWALGL